VSSSYAPRIGGLEKVAQHLARAWKEAGHEVYVITTQSSRELPPFEVIDGIPVSRHYFLWELPEIRLIPILKFLVQFLLFPFALWSLWRTLNPATTDIVNVHYVGPPAWWTVFIAKIRSIPVVVTLHGSDLLKEPHRSRLKHLMLRKVLATADEISTVSRFMFQEMERFFPECRGKGVVIWNGVDLSEFEGLEPPRAERPYGLCVARLHPQKGHHLLLDAYETFGASDPGFDLVFLGNGPMLETLEAKARESALGEQISFHGNVSHREVLSLMKGASFVVIPSEAEPFGLVAVEARMLGRPIVAFRRGALPEVLGGYAGVTWVEHDMASAMAQGMAAAMRSGKISQETVSVFDSWEIVAQKYIHLFSKHVEKDES